MVNVGDRYESLTITEIFEPSFIYGKHRRKIRCNCLCGRNKDILLDNWGKTKSCGCLLHLGREGKYINILGKKFGYLTVVRKVTNTAINDKHVLWECECVCGKKIIKRGSCLRSAKHKHSCGCKLKCRDLTGQKIHFWTVLEYAGKIKNDHLWLCRCECGIEKPVYNTHLLRKVPRSLSCGCKAPIKLKYAVKYAIYKNNRWQLLTPENKKKYREWRQAIYSKYGRRCYICKSTYKVVCHHLNSWNWDIANRYNPENGIPLCWKHHGQFHSLYKKGNNTKDQFIEFCKRFMLKKRKK